MLHELRRSITDELALLFTGSPVPSTQKTTESTQVVEESEDEGLTGSRASPAPSPPISKPDTDPPTNDSLPNSVLGSLSIHPNLSSPLTHYSPHPLFAIEQLGVDRRLLVNRKRQLKMYRVWMQGKFRKLA